MTIQKAYELSFKTHTDIENNRKDVTLSEMKTDLS